MLPLVYPYNNEIYFCWSGNCWMGDNSKTTPLNLFLLKSSCWMGTTATQIYKYIPSRWDRTRLFIYIYTLALVYILSPCNVYMLYVCTHARTLTLIFIPSRWDRTRLFIFIHSRWYIYSRLVMYIYTFIILHWYLYPRAEIKHAYLYTLLWYIYIIYSHADMIDYPGV